LTKTEDRFSAKKDITVEQYVHDTHEKLISLIREFERVLGNERCHEIVSEWAARESVSNVKALMAAEKKPIRGFQDVKNLLSRWVAQIDNDNMENVKIVREDSIQSYAHVSACVLAKVLRSMNAADIGQLLYCKHDFAGANAIHPSVALKREKTLMQGDDCCDFLYYWK